MLTIDFPSKSMELIHRWCEFHWQVARTKTLAYSGIRKIVSDVTWEIPGQSLLDLELKFSDIGYSDSGKLRQLSRNYWNPEFAESAMEKLLSRKGSPHASAAIRLQAGGKDSRSSGFCMQNMVITITKTSSFVDIYYRSTELSMKFLADLIFFNRILPPVFEKLGIVPEKIRFKFANVFMSALYQPVFMKFEESPVDFYNYLKKHDPRFWNTYARACSKYLSPVHNYGYKMTIRMIHFFHQHVDILKIEDMKSQVFREFVTDDSIKLEEEEDE